MRVGLNTYIVPLMRVGTPSYPVALLENTKLALELGVPRHG